MTEIRAATGRQAIFWLHRPPQFGLERRILTVPAMADAMKV
jgi:hypothetical protein